LADNSISGRAQALSGEQLAELASAAFQSGRLEEAGDLASQALSRSEQGQNFTALNVLGSVEMRRGNFSRAKELFTDATLSVPGSSRAGLVANLCVANRECHDIGGSIASGEQAVSIEPLRAFFWLNLALSQTMAGRHAEARRSITNALILDPDYNDAHVCLGHSLLLHGEYAAGFRELMYWKSKREEVRRRIPRFTMIEWNGMRLQQSGKLVVVCDEGLGDAIQYARWLPAAAAAAAMAGCGIVVLGAPELSILSRVDRVSQFRPRFEEDIGRGDGAWTRISTLPALLPMPTTTSAYLPRPATPFALPASESLRVGLCWRGSPFPRNRSMPIEDVVWMIGKCKPSIRFVSLQFGITTDERQALGQLEFPRFEDLEATARIVAELDLVVSVDTAVAHLAGAMGIHGIVALSANNDWRWGLAKSGPAPFYPSLTMVRQETPGRWRSVAATIAELVGSFAQTHRGRIHM
jgi:hypothetical protein